MHEGETRAEYLRRRERFVHKLAKIPVEEFERAVKEDKLEEFFDKVEKLEDEA